MDQKAIVQFYDSFIEAQRLSGINERIYGLYKRLTSLGLDEDSNVLELGCGIGTMTFLLSRVVTRGKIEAVDLSPASIQFATSRIQKNNIRFFVGDTVGHRPTIQDIDIVTLFDILEHIPSSQHGEMFKNIASYCADTTLIAINIPSPASVEYDRRHNPESLQIIDQALPLRHLLDCIEGAGMTLLHFETYSVWALHDYQYIVVAKKPRYDGVLLQQNRGLVQKGLSGIQRRWRKLNYRYP